ncbi:MAG TPA: radical SAM protein, partial [Candidatus Goldiibacteriota bacterium]|nr:radical SAM protein [Candidatus Goldiibacteriota bacterium]
MHNLREFTLAELSAAVKGLGFPEYRARQAYDWLYKSRVESVNDMKNLPAELKDKIAADYDCKLPELKAEAVSDIDNTVKYLFGFEDGASVESVLMYEDDRVTLCASTQAGCACGCRFCATGSLGYKRNLTVSEIIGQFIAAEKLSSVKITNIVFMGMGEPLLNWENLKKAVLILSDNKGINFSQTRITVSTV